MLDLLGKYIQAFGLLTTLKGDMEVNADDPMGMAQELLKHLGPKGIGVKGTLNLGLVDSFGVSGDGPKKLVVVARHPTILTDFLCYDVIKFHVKSSYSYEYEGIHIHSAEDYLMHDDRVVYTFTFDYLPKGTTGPLVLGPISDCKLGGFGYEGHTGDWKLTCKKVGDWKLTTMNCSEVNRVSFVSPKGQFYNFVDVSMRYMQDTEGTLELYFHGTRVSP